MEMIVPMVLFYDMFVKQIDSRRSAVFGLGLASLGHLILTGWSLIVEITWLESSDSLVCTGWSLMAEILRLESPSCGPFVMIAK